MATEAEALADILEWSAGCPDWQKDALRRLVTQSSVSEAEVADLVAICKGATQAAPLEAAHIRSTASDRTEVYLSQIHSVRHVNALAPDQRLSFRRSGMTIVYGDNGSGKSGYARILKKVCRARMTGRAEEIIPDIYDSSPGLPIATIDYGSAGQNRTCVWQLGQAGDPALTGVSVFDARTANVHVNEANDVAYTPFPLRLLASLASLCKAVRDSLAAEAAQLRAQTPEVIKRPACSPVSSVGQLMAQLSADTDHSAVEALAILSESERERLSQLTADLSGDPVRAGRQLEALKLNVEQHLDRLDRLFAAVTEQSSVDLRQLAIDRDTAQRAADAASVELFRDEPLSHIGSDVWRALWESARAFSEQGAYPERSFPVTSPGSVCVLCQQDLTAAGADRLNRFEAFVRDDSQRRAEMARVAYSDALQKFQSKAISLHEMHEILRIMRDDLGDDNLAMEVRRAVLTALWRHHQIRRRHLDPSATIDSPMGALPRQMILKQTGDLGTRAAALISESDSPARATLLAEKTTLTDRHWLGGIKADVLAEIDRLKEIARLQEAERSTVTNRITTKSTEVAQALVTDALRAQFTREVASFGIASLAVELRQQNSAQGVPRFRVALTRQPSASIGQVLSEGEHRCVALAAFMAELAATQNRSGIVFDDPVSSLDHMHREVVAKRLVAEAAHRQVIVFTHDLAFLFELDRAADDASSRPNVAISSVTRGVDKAGFCHNEPVLKARRVLDIAASLTRQLANERYHFEQGNQDEWRKTVKSITSTLRDTWEIAVEETVSHVIRRLSNEVKTGGLVKLTAITVQDCEVMRDAFARCSELLHSAAIALNRPLARPEALSTEIDTLAAWVGDIRQRQSAVRLT